MFWKKKKSIASRCSVCGQIHDEWPALTFDSPNNYNALSKAERERIAQIDSDFCIIKYEDQTARFIRVVLKQSITDSNMFLNYGLWVSLSEESFSDYVLNYTNENHEVQYFGWLNSRIPGYEDTLDIPTTVYTARGTDRPEILPYDDFDHAFVKDFYSGISMNEAEKRVHTMMKNTG